MSDLSSGFTTRPGTRLNTTTFYNPTTVSRTTVEVIGAGARSWSRSSNRTANYATKLMAQDIIPHQSYLYSRSDMTRTTGSVTSLNLPYSKTVNSGCLRNTGWETACVSFAVEENANVAVLQKKVDLEILLKVKDQKLNISNLIAEREQTIELFVSTARKLIDVFRSLKRGDIRAAGKALGVNVPKRAHKRWTKQHARDQSKALANGWIELQYGWKPLLGEAQGAAEALAKASNFTPFGSVKVVKQAQHGFGSRTSEAFASGIRESTNTCYANITCQSSVVFRVVNGWASTLAGVGLTNPLSPLWELTPWSFVVDWFIPVGDLIAALDATLGLTFVTGSKTTYIDRANVRSDVYKGTSDFGWTVTSKRDIDIVRSPLADFPAIPFPRIKSPLSWYHAANTLALLAQRSR